MKKNYKIKKTISIKRFIEDYGENLSNHIKDRLLELEIRCVLTREKNQYKLDLKHVEHIKYPTNSLNDTKISEKEYAYAQFIINEGKLYFTKDCIENDKVMKSPVVDTIFNSLTSETVILNENVTGKKIDDSNIDYVIDSILSVCPKVSEKYIEIVKHMKSLIS